MFKILISQTYQQFIWEKQSKSVPKQEVGFLIFHALRGKDRVLPMVDGTWQQHQSSGLPPGTYAKADPSARHSKKYQICDKKTSSELFFLLKQYYWPLFGKVVHHNAHTITYWWFSEIWYPFKTRTYCWMTLGWYDLGKCLELGWFWAESCKGTLYMFTVANTRQFYSLLGWALSPNEITATSLTH